jgi:hypothetical protein
MYLKYNFYLFSKDTETLLTSIYKNSVQYLGNGLYQCQTKKILGSLNV